VDEKKKEEAFKEEKSIKTSPEGESEEKYANKEENPLRRAKIQKLKELIEKGEYKVSPEDIAEKMLEFFKKNRD